MFENCFFPPSLALTLRTDFTLILDIISIHFHSTANRTIKLLTRCSWKFFHLSALSIVASAHSPGVSRRFNVLGTIFFSTSKLPNSDFSFSSKKTGMKLLKSSLVRTYTTIYVGGEKLNFLKLFFVYKKKSFDQDEEASLKSSQFLWFIQVSRHFHCCVKSFSFPASKVHCLVISSRPHTKSFSATFFSISYSNGWAVSKACAGDMVKVSYTIYTLCCSFSSHRSLPNDTQHLDGSMSMENLYSYYDMCATCL